MAGDNVSVKHAY